MSGTECQGKSCCESILVLGGTFPMGRSKSGTDAASGQNDEQPEHNVTVSDFHLDEYEVTVGRFRRFAEWYDGTPPPDGEAAHPSIAGSGWQRAWNTELPLTQADLIGSLKCKAKFQTWRDAPSGTEEMPINCVSWYAAFAFCAWDGGRLPTEAEWEYASAGGSENRLYPWGQQTPDNTLAAFFCTYDGNGGCAFEDIVVVGSVPAGAGRWGHEDLGGNMMEWTLDWYDANWYSAGGAICNDCANLNVAPRRTARGGAFDLPGSQLRAAYREYDVPDNRNYYIGFRCARSP
jgi:formylglycine-generating enzyme required for sulfatase activity